MAVPAFHDLRAAARRSLDEAHNPKRIILLHTGVTVLVSLLLALADYLLDRQISNTGGLSGLGMRSVLSTVQSVLQLARSVALPFWQMGYIFYTLKVAQGSDGNTSSLLEGFRRFGPVLRLKAMMMALMFAVMMLSSYLSSAIFMLTPWSAPLFEALTPMFSGEVDEGALMEIYESISPATIAPMMIIFLVCFIALTVPVYFRFRMADLWLMDHPGRGAFAALQGSRKMMKGNCLAIFKIDLHFWWFFLLDLLIGAVSYGDMLLPQLGIQLPFGETAAFFLFFGVYLVLQLLLYLWKQNEVSVTYAHAYEALKPSEAQPPVNPWNE